MTNLTDFLLARIAEDEAPTFELLPYDCEPGCCAPAGWVGHRCLVCQDAPSFGGTAQAITEICEEHEQRVHQRARVLAECEAKRRIVALWESWENNTWQSPPYWSAPMDEVLEALATIYADHPDFDPAWRAEVGA